MKAFLLKIVTFTILITLGGFLPALDLALRPAGFVFIPSGDGNKDKGGRPRYGIGGGANLGLELDLAGIWPNPLGLGYTVGIEGSLLYNALKPPAEGVLQTYSFGGDLGLYYFPVSRLLTRADGAVGIYQGITSNFKNSPGNNSGSPGLWWRFGGELGFRFTPMFILSANGGWRQFHDGNLFNSGIYAGLTAQINFEAGAASRVEGLELRYTQDDAVYPALLQLYQHYGAGNLTIRNNENAEIRNVRVSFRAANYTASEFSCGQTALLPRGRQIEMPLYADFSPELLKFSDSGRINGELIIRYSFLGKEKIVTRSLVVAVNGRNSFPGARMTDNIPDFSGVDWASLAAFISPTSLEVMEFSKNITGLARARMRTAISPNLHFGIWLFEGLGVYGMTIPEDAVTEAHFPAQTLAFKTGTALDIALLYASVLEAAGIPAAIIPLPGQESTDFIAAVSIGINTAAAGASFNGLDKLLIVNDEVWLPLSVKNINRGFTIAWDEGIKALNKLFADNNALDFVSVEEAWLAYPPAPFGSLNVKIAPPAINTTADRADRAIQAYITGEIIPRIAIVNNQIRQNPTAALYNQLGLLNLRAGRTADAKTAYERAADMNNVSGMINRGNIALTENDYAGAVRWFNRALSAQPGNEAARRGLEQAEANRSR